MRRTCLNNSSICISPPLNTLKEKYKKGEKQEKGNVNNRLIGRNVASVRNNQNAFVYISTKQRKWRCHISKTYPKIKEEI